MSGCKTPGEQLQLINLPKVTEWVSPGLLTRPSPDCSNIIVDQVSVVNQERMRNLSLIVKVTPVYMQTMPVSEEMQVGRMIGSGDSHACNRLVCRKLDRYPACRPDDYHASVLCQHCVWF